MSDLAICRSSALAIALDWASKVTIGDFAAKWFCLRPPVSQHLSVSRRTFLDECVGLSATIDLKTETNRAVLILTKQRQSARGADLSKEPLIKSRIRVIGV